MPDPIADPKVSVVIPTYNAAGLIEAAIESVAVQTLRDLEVILVDDASRDDTVARAEAALRRAGLRHQVLRLERNSGPAVARNHGVVAARGTYVAFLDADDVWLPGKLAAQARILDEEPNVTLCGCQASWVGSDGRVVEPLFTGLPPRMPGGWKRLLWHCYVATPCVMVRRDDLGIRPFDPRLRVGEDRDLWIKLAHNGVVALVPEELVRIRLSDSSFMANNLDFVRTCTLPMVRRHLRILSGELSFRQRCLARGSLYSQIGKQICKDRDRYVEGAAYLLGSVLFGYRPADGLRELVFRAPLVRDFKAFVKRRYEAS
ncbi:MAG: glycosyltransferase [Acetobacteraceae bacterium]|nr:glycosyltransferase [Acetobacteraceae bacterium]